MMLLLLMVVVMGVRVRESQARYTSSGQPALVFTFFREDKTTKEVEPGVVSALVDVESEVDALEKLAFHFVELCKGNARHL